MTDFEREINHYLMEALVHERLAQKVVGETKEDCAAYNAEVKKAHEALAKVEELLDKVSDGDYWCWLEDVLSADLIARREMAWDEYFYLYKQGNALVRGDDE